MREVGIIIASEQKKFLIALALQFIKLHDFKVTIFARDKYVVDLANKILPIDNKIHVIDCSKLSVKLDTDAALKEAEKIENRYSVKLSMLLSEDRALGQGYLSNVEKVPDIKRASWAYTRKIREIVNEIITKERILNKLNIVIQRWPNKITTMILRNKGASSFSFVPIKYGNRYFWSDNDFITGELYIKRLKEYCENYTHGVVLSYEIDKMGDIKNKKAKYTYTSALKASAQILINDSKNFARGINKIDSYHYLGWLPSRFRSVSNYKYVKKNSVKPGDLSEYQTVFFPLHLEPEVALQYFSPEFSNSMEAIVWISKSLPVNYIVVVKEQANSYGVRSRWYYKQLIKIPNVVMSHPDSHSWDWIKSSNIVATITGTAGQEAVNFEKPVLSFGKHQIINYLPTVYYVSNYIEVNKALDGIIHQPPTQDDYNKSRTAFIKAQIESSIDMPMLDNNIELETAAEALNHLANEYPEVF